MRRLALLAIRLYQRHLSPYKGFCCAYRVHTGCASCSELGYRAIRRHGVFTGLGLLRDRTRRCGEVHRQQVGAMPWRSLPVGQRGVCDCACDLPCDAGCDAPGADCKSNVCRTLDCLDCCSGCDWPSRRDRPARTQRRGQGGRSDRE